jgi:DNA replication regulator DPB11
MCKGLLTDSLPAEARANIANQVRSNGATYEGDLTKQITHLISFRTDGAKYNAARNWKIQVVSPEWLRDSLERGMILDEGLYDPILPAEERGKGAWDKTKPKRVSLGKRSRDASVSGMEGVKRKLRRTASTKLNSQSGQMWEDIVGGGNTTEVARSGVWDAQDDTTQPSFAKPRTKAENTIAVGPAPPLLEHRTSTTGFFSGCRFYSYGFSRDKEEVLCRHLVSQGAEVVGSLDELRSVSNLDPPAHLFMVVPHDLPISKHPDLPLSQLLIRKITVWWVEKCIHDKKFIDPDQCIIGRPFPVFPIVGFQGISVCSSGFSGIDLLHLTKAINLIGAKYTEDMTHHCSVLISKSQTGLRKDKYEYAKEWKIPIVAADWLWECISQGVRIEPKAHTFRSQKLLDALPNITALPKTKPAEEKERSPPTRNDLALNIEVKQQPSPVANTSVVTAPNEAAKIKQEEEIHSAPKEIQASDATSEDASFKLDPLSERDPISSSKTVSTAPAPSGHPHSKSIHEDYSSGISDLLAKTRRSVQPASNEGSEGGRKRGSSRIFGRVASNMSATSNTHSRSASVDSTATHNNAVEPVATKDDQLAMFLNGDRKMEKDNESQPPSTQLQYADEESAEVTERVMARMLGEKLPPKRSGLKQKAITITSVSDLETRARSTRQRAR